MGADISRIRFDALQNFAGVQLEQGKPLLDADLNALWAILDRRIRAATSDILGRSAVAANTPEAFHITIANGGGLQIGNGRIYVDGLLADNHGAWSTDSAKKLFDPIMAETEFQDPVPYDQQPYLPSPPKLPESGTFLVYVDVWDREVTHLEQPDLVEVAVGVETSTRVQTVWQVRLLKSDASNITCATPDEDIPGWAALIAPSTGRLMTGTFEVPPGDDPCELPPTGGYRGLENQAYRVEIHDPGQPGGTATFKWSRDVVGSRVITMRSAVELELESLGRDDVLRFNTGDWIEIVDNVREMSQRSGEMRQITVINEAARRIAFAEALPPEMLPATFPGSTSENPRVMLWHQNHKVRQTGANGTTSVYQDLDDAGTAGVIKVPAAGTTLLLENGVTVTFTSTGEKGFRAGDSWVFAARTADASVELLQNEPPREVQHRYARLAVFQAATGSLTDCRTHWPPTVSKGGDSCACTLCVTPRQHDSGQLTIQMALNQVRDRVPSGGTVCLEVGDYELKDGPLKIDVAGSVKLIGRGVASRLVARQSTGAIVITKSHDVVLDSFSIECSGLITVPQAAVRVEGSSSVCLEHLTVTVVDGENPKWTAIEFADALSDVTLRGNAIGAPIGIGGGNVPGPGGTTTVRNVRIEDNDLDCSVAAISFGSASQHQWVLRICGNRVNGCKEAGFLLNGVTAAGSGVDVQANVFSVLGHGVVASSNGLRLFDNTIVSKDATSDQCGILLVPLTGRSLTDCQILANRIQGFSHAGILIMSSAGTSVNKATIEQNQITGVDVGLELASGGVLDQLSIENNQFSGITGSAILAKGGEGEARYTATGNQIRTTGHDSAVVLEFKVGEGIFSHNECYCDGAAGPGVPILADVRLQSTTLIVDNNRLVGGLLSLDLQALRFHYTVLGNICRGKIRVESGTELTPPSPWAPLNLQDVDHP